ncbi:helix-turn-helix transcriptional regulator [Wolbachia endosymbiont (group A) of Cheilosia soror]|uniref:helix-turn-helix transcriptional regulator n=1 Tax=Wolbachia endosymbiont (group A) of Cheilosia soror TaxID=2953995 RepID=UPI0021F8D8F5|nr:helix-turn-helix transcriptional regulator [Wolbachia endosymbiont (group A) of Cheilosia soror]
MSTPNKKITPDSLYYKIIQEIRDERLKLGLSQEDVAKGIGVSKLQVARYEQRREMLSPTKFEKIATVLLKDAEDIFSELTKEVTINSKDQKALSVVQNLRKFKDLEFRNALCILAKCLSKSIQMNKRVTYTKSLNFKMKYNLQNWRFVRVYTQTDLGERSGLSHQQIQRYEQEVNDISFQRASEMEKALSLSDGVLLPRSKDEVYYEDEDSEGEKRILSFMKGYQNIKIEKLQDVICSFLSEIAEICEEENEEMKP